VGYPGNSVNKLRIAEVGYSAIVVIANEVRDLVFSYAGEEPDSSLPSE
jgi:hypothetical protein